MKTLVVYYSLTGNNEKAARIVADSLSAELEAVETVKKFAVKEGKPTFGTIFTGGMGSFLGRLPKIKPAGFDPAQFDLVVLCAPLWAGNLAPPMRAYVAENRRGFRGKVAFLCISGSGNGFDKAVKLIEEAAGKKLAGALSITDKEMEGGAYAEKAKMFAAGLKLK